MGSEQEGFVAIDYASDCTASSESVIPPSGRSTPLSPSPSLIDTSGDPPPRVRSIPPISHRTCTSTPSNGRSDALRQVLGHFHVVTVIQDLFLLGVAPDDRDGPGPGLPIREHEWLYLAIRGRDGREPETCFKISRQWSAAVRTFRFLNFHGPRGPAALLVIVEDFIVTTDGLCVVTHGEGSLCLTNTAHPGLP